MDKNTTIKIANRDSGTIVYSIPELGVRRTFQPRETKEITFGELESLSYIPGGIELLQDFLIIRNEEAAEIILPNIEPEYYYTSEDVKRILTTGSLNEFLDCLDFAPEGVLEMIKDISVDLPLTDTNKRDAILEKLSFNVSRAIEIKNTKYDGGDEADNESNKPKRRVIKQKITVPERRVPSKE